MRRFVVALTIVVKFTAVIGLLVVFYTGAINQGCHLYTLSIGLSFPEGFVEPDWQPATVLEGVSVRGGNLETDLRGHPLVLQAVQGGYLAVLGKDKDVEMAAIETEEGGIVDVAVVCQKILFPGNIQASILAKYVAGEWWAFRP